MEMMSRCSWSFMKRATPFLLRILHENRLTINEGILISLRTENSYPLILWNEDAVTSIFLSFYYLHVGSQAVYSTLRQVCWIMGEGARSLRKFEKNFVVWSRFRSDSSKQIMVDLLTSRVRPGKAVLRLGTDICWAFLVNPCRGRGATSMKMYVCIFVCFITKSVHMEFVSELTSDAIITC